MEEKIVELEGKKVSVKPAPATVGYDVALRYREAIDKKETVKIQDCLYELLKFCELDLGDGRMVKLDNKQIINQHFHKPQTLLALQSATMEVNFGFLAPDTHLDS